jgi:surface protein
MRTHYLLFSAILLLSALPDRLTAQNFYLHHNGVTVMCPNAEIGESGEVNGVTYTKRDRQSIHGGNAETTCTSGVTSMYNMFASSSFDGNISSWDVSSVTDMSGMFHNATSFNGDLSSWDVSSVTSMAGMFLGTTSFDQDLSNWDVSSVTNMAGMFRLSTYNGDLSSWDVSNVTNMNWMFRENSDFNGDLSSWDVSNVMTMAEMFWQSHSFNGDLSSWDVSSVTDMSEMFRDNTIFSGDLSSWDVSSVTKMSGMFWNTTYFNADLSGWDVSNVTDMSRMFRGTNSFTGDLSGWDVSSVTNMSGMFQDNGEFSGNLSSWDVSSVTDMSWMFRAANSFNGDLSGWDVSSVTNMSSMFRDNTIFSGDLSSWDVSSVTDMSWMFASNSVFNNDLSGWDVSSVTSMSNMFTANSAFNNDISSWDVSSVTHMSLMFYDNSAFNGDLSSWDVSSVTNMARMFHDSSYNGDLSSWDVRNVSNMGSMFRNAQNFNQDLSSWCVPLISSTPSFFSTGADSWTLPKPNWGCVSTDFVLADNNVTVMCSDANIGDYGGINGIVYTKRSRDQITPENASKSCTSGIQDMSELFYNESDFNEDISSWDVSSVTNMMSMFWNATSFNGDVSNWDVSNVTTMVNLFRSANSFNQDLGNWNIENVANLFYAFNNTDWSTENYESTLTAWSAQNLQSDVTLGVLDVPYCTAYAERQLLIDTFNWNIQGDRQCLPEPIAFIPENEEEYVSSASQILSLFNISVGEGDFSGISIQSEDSTPIEILNTSISEDSLQVFHDGLPYDNLVTVNIPENTVVNQDGAGNAAFSWNFQTIMAVPEITARYPAEDAVDIPVSSDITIEFDQDIFEGDFDQLTLQTGETLSPTGMISIEDSTLTISSLDLAFETEYTLTIGEGTVVNQDSVANQLSSWSFTTVITPPDVVELISPENNEEGVSVYPEFTWTSSDRSEEYLIEVSDTIAFTNPAYVNTELSDTLYTLSEPLQSQSTYYWRVAAANIGGQSGWSEVYSFQTGAADMPIILAPASGDTLSPPIQLVWKEENPDKYNYNLHVSTHPEFGDTLQIVSSISDTTFMLSQADKFTNNQPYYWRIQKQEIADTTLTGQWAQSSFFISVDKPEILTPEEGAIVEPPVVLQWNKETKVDDYHFNLHLSSHHDFSDTLRYEPALTDSFLVLGQQDSLKVDETFYWRLRRQNIANTNLYSEWAERTFTVEMQKPILATPDNGTSVEPPFNLTWQAASDNEYLNYQIHLSHYDQFSDTLYFETGISDTLFANTHLIPGVENGNIIHWRVRSKSTTDSSLLSEWSEEKSFQIDLRSPKVLAPDDHELLDLPITLSWEQEDGYVYDLEVFDIQRRVGDLWSGFRVVNESGLDQNSFTIHDLDTNNDYAWWVRKRIPNTTIQSDNEPNFFNVKADFVRLSADTVFATRPSNVNIFLSARDQDGRGVTTLELDDFQLLENGRTIVEAETNLQVARQDMVDSSLKTVLLLNNSLSIGEENIELIREAAKEFVRNKTPEQEIAIKIFAEHSELVLPFTKDENELLDALSEFRLTDTPGTDVNGSVVKALDLWEDEFSFNNINQGYLLLFTDGRDLAGTTSLQEVIEARGNKQVFAIGVQNRPEDFDEPALREIGNAGVIIEDDFSNLIFNFLDIQQRLEQLSNSFYWFNYSSARRSSDGELNVRIAGNQNTGPDSEINVFFDASDFYGVPVDIIVNGTPENPRGVDEIFMAGDDTLGVRIETAFSFELLPFEFEISDPTKLEIDPVGDDSFIFNFIGNALDGDVIEVAIADTSSPTLELEKILTVHFGERQSGPPTAALLAPSDGAEQVSLSPQFEWSEVTGAEEYRFQLSTDEEFDSFHTNMLTADTDFAPEEPLQRETTYHWRVRVENADETSRWSTSRSFTTRDRAIAENLRVEVDQGQVTLRWDADPLDSDDTIEIHGGETSNEMEMIAELPHDARSYSDNLDAGLLYAVSIRYADGSDSDFTNIVTFSEQSVQATPAWDLVSISIHSEQSTLSQSDLYEFSGTYSTADNLQPGKGYWVRSDENEELVVAGDGLSEATYSLRRGWNLIGALISETDAASIADPDSILTATPLFSYADGAYAEADTLTPGHGYWLYASDDGEVTLKLTAGEEENGEGDAGNHLLAEQSVADELYRIRFSNSRATQTIFASDQPLDDSSLQAYRVPPQAPAPVLDVRSGGFRITDRNSSPLQLSSEHYPVTVRMEAPRDAMESDFIYRILAVDDGAEVHYNLSDESDVVIGKAYDELYLERVHSSEAITEFAMDQNYPNPFNPTTTIRYQLANQVDVSVIVYDILGRRVATLVNAVQQPGVYTVDFDARHLASGVYMLRIRAGSFTEIQTMTLIK